MKATGKANKAPCLSSSVVTNTACAKVIEHWKDLGDVHKWLGFLLGVKVPVDQVNWQPHHGTLRVRNISRHRLTPHLSRTNCTLKSRLWNFVLCSTFAKCNALSHHHTAAYSECRRF